MSPRLKLIPTERPTGLSWADQHLCDAMLQVFAIRGFTGLQTAITRQTERLAKAKRETLAQEGWIA